MLWLHHVLGVSDAFLLGDRDSQLFNFAMVGVCILGIAAFAIHTLSFARRSRRWLAIKVLVLGAYWGAIMIWAKIYENAA